MTVVSPAADRTTASVLRNSWASIRRNYTETADSARTRRSFRIGARVTYFPPLSLRRSLLDEHRRHGLRDRHAPRLPRLDLADEIIREQRDVDWLRECIVVPV